MSDNSIDQQFIEYIVKALVGDPDAVSINRTIDERGVLLELTVAPEDLGRVIGKRGGTAQSIRTLLRALGTKNDARYNLKIVDTDGGEGATRSADRQNEPETDTEGESIKDTDQASNEPVEEAEEVNTSSPEETSDNVVEEATSDAVENTDSELSEKTRKSLADLDDLDI